jgi:hypothetical protein
MKNRKSKWWLAAVAMCCLAPAALAQKGYAAPCAMGNFCVDPPKPSTTAVPEGGSTAIYLLGAGLTCFGAMFLRSRLAKPRQS